MTFPNIWLQRKSRPKKKRQKRFRERNLQLSSIPLNLLKKTITKITWRETSNEITKRRTEHTVTTKDGNLIHRKHISGPIVFQNGKKKERARQIGDKITPKNRHCLGGGDGKYNQWNETLRDIPNGKLKIIRNRTRIQTPNLRARKVGSVIKMRVTPKKTLIRPNQTDVNR